MRGGSVAGGDELLWMALGIIPLALFFFFAIIVIVVLLLIHACHSHSHFHFQFAFEFEPVPSGILLFGGARGGGVKEGGFSLLLLLSLCTLH